MQHTSTKKLIHPSFQKVRTAYASIFMAWRILRKVEWNGEIPKTIFAWRFSVSHSDSLNQTCIRDMYVR